MNEALRSILCNLPDYWQWSPYSSYMVKFNEDGTGELWCMQELTYLFAVNLKWRILSHSRPAGQPQPTWVSAPQLLGTLRLEITLEKSIAKGMTGAMAHRETMRRLHDDYLLDAAWRPKIFTVSIEKGNFLAPASVGHAEGAHRIRYGLRLVFDRSPFPPLEEWNIGGTKFVPPVGPADETQAPMLEFVNRSLPQEECRGRAMNDISGTLGGRSCIMS